MAPDGTKESSEKTVAAGNSVDTTARSPGRFKARCLCIPGVDQIPKRKHQWVTATTYPETSEPRPGMHWRPLVVRRSRSSRQIRRRWPEDATPCKCLHTFTNRVLFYVPIEVYKNLSLPQTTCLTRMTTAGAAAEHLSSSPSFTKLLPNQFMRDLIRQPLKCDSRGTLRSLGASCRGRWGPCPWLRHSFHSKGFPGNQTGSPQAGCLQRM